MRFLAWPPENAAAFVLNNGGDVVFTGIPHYPAGPVTILEFMGFLLRKATRHADLAVWRAPRQLVQEPLCFCFRACGDATGIDDDDFCFVNFVDDPVSLFGEANGQ